MKCFADIGILGTWFYSDEKHNYH